MTKALKLGAAVVAVAAAVLLMPYVRDVIDALGAGEDDVDSTVSTLIEWLIAVAIAVLIYSGLVALPRLVTRRRERPTPR